MRSEQIFMKKSFLRQIWVSSLFFMLAGGSACADENLPLNTKRIQRSFTNLSFEQFTTGVPKPDESGWSVSSPWAIYNQDKVIGWRSTARKETNTGVALTYRGIEIWNEKLSGSDESKASQGDYYAELNAHVASRLYQNICILKDDTFTWSLDHKPRDKSTESMKFVLSDMIEDKGEAGDIKPNNSIQVGTEIISPTVGAWKTHNSLLQVKADDFLGGQAAAVKAFGFEAITGGNVGNFIDNIKVNLKPAVEFSAQSGETFENNSSKYQSINFKIIGLVEGDITVSFVVDLKKNVAPSKIAEYGKDYKIYSTSGDTYHEIPVTLSQDKTQLQFTYTVKYNSGLDYANGVIVKGLVVELLDNELLDGDKVIPFGLNSAQSGSVKLMGTEVCGTLPVSEFSYTILDNDTDLSISKTLNTEKIPVSNGLVSYDLVLENKGLGTAKDVTLKDTLLANLTKTDSTQLICTAIENGGKTATCPALTAKSVEQLFSKEGLALSNIVGSAKFKFSLSGLKVSANDTSAGKYLGKIVNKAEVSTSSNDIDLTNNNAIAENLIVAGSDLSNNKSGAVQNETGTGLFYIAQGGRKGTTPLIEKIANTLGRVYFPLNIQNSSVYAQNYKLYASSTAIEPDSEADYSALKGSSISSFVNGLKIKFYPVIDSECKAGLSNSDISQMNVPANSTAQVCAEITGTSAEATNVPVWFAIESLETGLGDIIKNSIVYSGLATRNLVLVNDQQAQVQIGGTYVFAHRLTNSGSMTESDIQIALNPLTPKDGFAYTLFIDKNSNGVLDSDDVQVKLTDALPKLKLGEHLALLIKVQSPSTATNGMKSQVELKVTPLETVNKLSLLPLINLDTITVGINQISLQKMQFKQAQCLNMVRDQVIKAPYQISSQSIGSNDCIVYRIMVTNIGAETITSIDINDMYPAYTTPWSSNQVLPMTDSNEKVTEKNQQIKTLIKELKPNEKKSLYFGIKLQ